jgi:hypothetical protein
LWPAIKESSGDYASRAEEQAEEEAGRTRAPLLGNVRRGNGAYQPENQHD